MKAFRARVFAPLFLLVGAGFLLGTCAHQELKPGQALTEEARHEAIRRAHVWSPTVVRSVNFRVGPRDKNMVAPGQWITCDYKPTDYGGKSPKFTCIGSGGQEYKVKYGDDNAEVIGEVLASRLLWGLGFGADRMYPVRVRCRGCSEDPADHKERAAGTAVFDPAAIEWKLPGRPLETRPDSGWKWDELDDIGPGAPPNERAHREGLKLLAAFIQHTDSKADNQRLSCPPGASTGRNGCSAPLMMIHDLGLTFGRSGLLNKNENSVRLAKWAALPVWRNPATCEAQLYGSLTGTVSNPVIREEGRAFLAGLLAQLSDAQLRDLFEISGVKHRPADTKDESAPASVDQWVAAFKSKRAQVVDHRCPN
jgi:hypothetical protein